MLLCGLLGDEQMPFFPGRVRRWLRKLINRVTQTDVILSQMSDMRRQVEGHLGLTGDLIESAVGRLSAQLHSVRPYYYLGGYRALTLLSTGSPFLLTPAIMRLRPG